MFFHKTDPRIGIQNRMKMKRIRNSGFEVDSQNVTNNSLKYEEDILRINVKTEWLGKSFNKHFVFYKGYFWVRAQNTMR